MDGFRSSGFVGEDSLEFDFWEAGLLTIKGEISCLGDIVISVNKTLEVQDDGMTDPPIQTFLYAYNAFVRGQNSFLRHDNTHRYPDHADEHHRHELDWRSGEELAGSPLWVGSDGWPTLGKFMEEVEGWYWKRRAELPNPESYGAIDVRG
jgi:hypothetical protein